MNTFKITSAVFTLLCLSSCKMLCDKYYQVNNIKEEINIDKVEEDLTKSTNFNFTAQKEVSEAHAPIILTFTMIFICSRSKPSYRCIAENMVFR